MTVICTEADSQLRSDAHARAWATIDLQALRANLSLVRTTNPNCSLVVIVKANAYGHGLIAVAGALRSQLCRRKQRCAMKLASRIRRSPLELLFQ